MISFSNVRSALSTGFNSPGKIMSSFKCFSNGLRNGRRLFVNLPPHGVRMVVVRSVFGFSYRQSSLRNALCFLSLNQRESYASAPSKCASISSSVLPFVSGRNQVAVTK